MTLSRLLDERGVATFHEARDRTPHVFQLTNHEWLESSWQSAVGLLHRGALAPNLVRLVKNGREVGADSLTTVQWVAGRQVRLCEPNSVARLQARGYTLLITGLERITLDGESVCTSLTRQLAATQCDMNGYLTPKGNIGFRPHHDPQDVLICQLRGSKSWQFYEPLTTLPVASEYGQTDVNAVGLQIGQVDLQEGQALYIPRGWGHSASARDSESLHVTVGWTPITVDDALVRDGKAPVGGVEGRRSAGSALAKQNDTVDDGLKRTATHSDFFKAEYVAITNVIHSESELASLVSLILEDTDPARLRILDLGCGFGRLAVPLALSGAEVVGIDRNKDLLDVGRQAAETKRLPNLTLLLLDLETLDPTSVRGSGFDVVMFIDSVLGGSDVDDVNLLRKAKETLRQGGRVVIEQLNPFAVGRNAREDGSMDFRFRVEGGQVDVEDHVTFAPTTGMLRTNRLLRHSSRPPSWTRLDVRLRTVDEWRSVANAANLVLGRVCGLNGEALRLDTPRMVLTFVTQ